MALKNLHGSTLKDRKYRNCLANVSEKAKEQIPVCTPPAVHTLQPQALLESKGRLGELTRNRQGRKVRTTQASESQKLEKTGQLLARS